ncbi:PspC domain-containing protein [Capnocytophaga granulosa]|uniref:PspC domain-containing protein n=1 Tax=Capnocytophaga granulosa TaxID=45242 RepID=UPI0023F39706|nr:PspC domain-containing protein [Capnocytophaga granulosa]
MDKTHNISLGGFSFIIENGAASQLSAYLTKVRQYLGQSADTDEILSDVEQRMAELLKARMQVTEVVTLADINYLIEVMGQPQQYVQEEETLAEGKNSKLPFRLRKLYRDKQGKKLAGVLSGLSYYFQTDVTLLRIIYILLLLANSVLFLPSASFWIVLYIIFWIVIPPADTTTEKLEMKGVEANLDTIFSFKVQEPSKEQVSKNNTEKKTRGLLGGLLLLFKAVGYFIAIIFFVLIFFVLVAVLLSVLSTGLVGGITSVFLTDYLPFVLSPAERVLFYLIWAMILALFFSILVWGCYKIFSVGHYRTPRTWFLVNVLLFVLPIFAGLALATNVARKFVSYNAIEEKIAINTTADTLLLSEKYLAPYNNMYIDSLGNGKNGDVHFIGIYPTKELIPFLQISTSSRGKDTDDALVHIRNIDYPLEIADNHIYIPNGYYLKKGKTFRFQNIRIRLFLPNGKTAVSFSPSSKLRGLSLPRGIYKAVNDSIVEVKK